MNYEDFASILNRHIFGESKKALLEKLASEPHRFVGLFRPSKPKTKVMQYLLQSREIRFGDAMEELIEQILTDLGFTQLDKVIQGGNRRLRLDQHFEDDQRAYFVEQKVRDDHDSSKKVGQIENYARKLELLTVLHEGNLIGAMYFIDPGMHKNQGYYIERLNELEEETGVELHLFYGSELFEFLGCPEVWGQMTEWLARWQGELPDFPELNFDLNPEQSLEEIKDIAPRYLESLVSNTELWDSGIMRVLFPQGMTLRLLEGHLARASSTARQRVARALSQLLEARY